MDRIVSFCRMPDVDPALPARLTSEHRRLDEIFGAFLAAAAGKDLEAARRAIGGFDEELRRHTGFEESHVIPPAEGRRLVPDDGADASSRLHRELRLEHVQLRELAAMIRRLLEEKGDLEAARRLAPNLARRWDAHTTREETELFPKLG
jgi:Hemerythrin HHE cation binding domain